MEAIGGLTEADEDCGPFTGWWPGRWGEMAGYVWVSLERDLHGLRQPPHIVAATAHGGNASEGLF
jgi:hypothetical protein